MSVCGWNTVKYCLVKRTNQISIFRTSNWASEASPTLGCSIEISRDIYMYIYICVCLSYVKSRGITCIKHAHAQSQYWAVKSDQ